MDKENNFGDDNMMKKSPTKIDDFTKNIKENTMNFLSNERSDEKSEEKSDAEKPKVDLDDFLNFHDDFNEPKKQESSVLPSFEKKNEIIEEPRVAAAQPEPEPEQEIDFHAIDDEFLNPYASSTLKGFETQNEKFISSEDLLTDFKDPIPAPPKVEAPKPVVIEKPPVTEPIKPVVEPPKPKSAPPPAPVKQKTSDDTQIEAEKIFKSIGLGE